MCGLVGIHLPRHVEVRRQIVRVVSLLPCGIQDQTKIVRLSTLPMSYLPDPVDTLFLGMLFLYDECVEWVTLLPF